MRQKILGAAIGQCVHVAGLDHFLTLCERHGWQAVSLGPAVPPSSVLAAIETEKPDIVAVSYRLTADDVAPLLDELRHGADKLTTTVRWVFGGTPPVADVARHYDLFERVFDGTEGLDAVESFIRGSESQMAKTSNARDLV